MRAALKAGASTIKKIAQKFISSRVGKRILITILWELLSELGERSRRDLRSHHHRRKRNGNHHEEDAHPQAEADEA